MQSLMLFPIENSNQVRNFIEISFLRKILGTIAKEEANCGICLSEYENGEEIKSLPMCLHHFHKECIDKWLSINKICPVCREEITLTGRRK